MTQTRIARYLLWALLAVPGLVLLTRYLAGASFYGEVVHLSGQWAVYTMLLAMVVSPLRLLWPARGWTAWLLRSRRYFGVASFAYATLHTAVYLQRKGSLDRVVAEAAEPGLLTGWIGLAIFLPLAVSSNDFSVRLLRRWWKRLHRLVYPAAFVVMAHWLLTAFDRSVPACYLALLVAILVLRVVLLTLKKIRGAAPA